MPYPEVFEIRAGETRTLSLDFTDRLPTGVGLAMSGHSVSAVNHFSGAAASVLGSSSPDISGLVASAVVTGVAVGDRYDVSFTLELDDATPSVIVESVLVIGVDIL
jgi:hypothetical protein